MCDCAEELERRNQEQERRAASVEQISEDPPTGWSFFKWGGEGGSPKWFLGSTALFGLLALVYKNLDKLKDLVWKTKTFEDVKEAAARRKSSREKIKACLCKDEFR